MRLVISYVLCVSCLIIRDGDIYAALRDCHSALCLDARHRKAHFRLARCLLQLTWASEAHACLESFKAKFPDYAKYSECQALERDITAAVFSSSDKGIPNNPEKFKTTK